MAFLDENGLKHFFDMLVEKGDSWWYDEEKDEWVGVKSAYANEAGYAADSSVAHEATKAGKLSTSRSIGLTGDVTGSGSFNGSKDLSISTTVKTNRIYGKRDGYNFYESYNVRLGDIKRENTLTYRCLYPDMGGSGGGICLGDVNSKFIELHAGAGYLNTVEVNDSVCPKTNAAGYVGNSSKRWAGIYSSSAVNVSSDLTVKTDISEIDDRYIKLFDIVQPYAYKFVDGTSGRIHTGFISQYVEEAMKQVGLEDTDLAFFCKDALYEEAMDEEGNIIQGEPILDEDGNQKYFYSLRYEEYIAIMTEKIKRMEQKHAEEKADFEARLSALESKLSSM